MLNVENMIVCFTLHTVIQNKTKDIFADNGEVRVLKENLFNKQGNDL